ncbi:Gfo/Idh/MocA family oxidoreductase [Kitasatospora sp. A2-31]|uniref:Gfo/Idh/MocA family protein n=1 Tax=Kitasatospora sp. A2-31 TaxID=2916414 RepID=UPI0027E2400C|nr:Gfo/Idh/MocA family oxidoreductase [Kitasatospora sp. A2-31]
MERLNVGVLGCASIARRKMLPALTASPLTRVAAVASRSGERAGEFAAEFGTEPVAGYQALLDRPDVDAVYVPLPAGLRAEWIVRALEAGKHVLAEKPLTTDPAPAREVVELSRRRGLLLMESFMFLHHSAHRRVRDLVESGRIGEPRSFSAEFTIPRLPEDDIRHRPELGGGALLDLGAYTVRAAQLFCGPRLGVAGAVLRHDPVTGVDTAGAALLTSPRLTATLTFGMEHHYRCRYSLTGSEGTATLDRAFTPPPDHRPVLRIERQEGTEELLLPADDHFANIVAAFARTALAGRGFTGHGDRILRQADLLDQVRRAAAAAPPAA